MKILENFKFFNAVEEQQESNVLKNGIGSVLILQVEGNASSFEIKVEGSIDNESEKFFDIAVINNETFEISNNIKDIGIYSVGVDGYSNIKLDLASISGGYVSVFGKLGE